LPVDANWQITDDEGREMDAPTLDITDLAAQAGVSARTIRYYGELGLLPAAERGPGGRRRFGADAPERLRFIARLKRLGLTLEEIGDLNRRFSAGATPAMLAALLPKLDQRLAQVEESLTELTTLKQDLASYRDRISRRLND
jgi:DNA-binding transcriptional MerR regulator